MQKTIITCMAVGVFAILLSGCAEDNYNAGYNSYENQNDREVDSAISQEMNSLSKQDIAQLNTLK
jgi:PBP1b-binding outer membrane lipoprotein LpoB